MQAGAPLLRRGRWRQQWALGRVCTPQPGVSCGVCSRARAAARRCSGCVGGIARCSQVLRVHGVGRRGGTRCCVLVRAAQPGAGCGAQFCEEREPWAAGAGCEGGEGGGGARAAQAAVSTAAQRRVCVIAGLRPRGSRASGAPEKVGNEFPFQAWYARAPRHLVVTLISSSVGKLRFVGTQIKSGRGGNSRKGPRTCLIERYWQE